MIDNTTDDSIDIKPNPISTDTPLAGTLAAETGEDQFTVAAKLDAEIRAEEEKRMMNPGAYAFINTPYDVVKSAAKKTQVELKHPEVDIVDDKPTTSEQAPGADQFSVDEMNNWDNAAAWANSQQPNDDDITGMGIAMNEPVNAGEVNGDSDITNQSLDFINSFEPTPEQPGPEVDVVPDAEGGTGDMGEVAPPEEDPSELEGDGI